MPLYPEIGSALAIVFSTQTGLEDDSAARLFRRMLENGDWRARLERELLQAFSSPDTPWRELVQNDRYEVDEPDSDDEARVLLAKLLWEPTFPGRDPPNPGTHERVH
jgi:hypothetical protein